MHNGHHHGGVAHSFHRGHHAILHVSIALPLSDAKACMEGRSHEQQASHYLCDTLSASMLSNILAACC